MPPTSTAQAEDQSKPAAQSEGEDSEEPDSTQPLPVDQAAAITRTIAIIETGGRLNCNVTGASGEKGCHQFMPSTWKGYSKQVFGRVVEQTPENAEHVVYEKVKGWLAQGYTPRQIFLIWNQGNPGQCRRGVNKYGARYDSCSYAEKSVKKLAEVMNSSE